MIQRQFLELINVRHIHKITSCKSGCFSLAFSILLIRYLIFIGSKSKRQPSKTLFFVCCLEWSGPTGSLNWRHALRFRHRVNCMNHWTPSRKYGFLFSEVAFMCRIDKKKNTLHWHCWDNFGIHIYQKNASWVPFIDQYSFVVSYQRSCKEALFRQARKIRTKSFCTSLFKINTRRVFATISRVPRGKN